MKFLLLLLLLLPQAVLAATITGAVYDLELNQVSNAVVTISRQVDSRPTGVVTAVPDQRIVARNGTYQFTIPGGKYQLTANTTIEGETWVVRENISMASDGRYVLDLILAPTFEELDKLPEDELQGEDLPVIAVDESAGFSPVIWLIPVAIFGALAILYLMQRRPARVMAQVLAEDEYKSAVLDALKRHGGRITQRELRREVPFSEAKVSLVIAELEAEGAIKKIKKGRGNVIVKS